MTRRALTLAICTLLAACAAAPASAPPSVAKVEKSAVERLFEVRIASLDANDALEVQPLEAPEITDLRLLAEQAEQRNDFAAAEQHYRQALGLLPDAPALLQGHAEMLLVLDQLDAAEQTAARAYELGPKLGPLCRRSWAAVRLARELRGDPQAASTAAEQALRCATPPPVRM